MKSTLKKKISFKFNRKNLTDPKIDQIFKKLSLRYKTPAQVQRFIRTLKYNRKPTLYSAYSAFKQGSSHCMEATLLAAAILEQHGYPALLLSLESMDGLGHTVFVYKSKGKWGAIGRSRDAGLHGRKPVYRSIRDLMWSYFDPYIDKTGKLTEYALIDFSHLDMGWRYSKKNVWALEKYVLNQKHKKIKHSPRRYKKVYATYLKNGPLTSHPDWL